jgi:hypothetical protein
MNDEYIQHIIENGERVVIESEATPGNLSRPLLVHYVLNGEIVVEAITYRYASDSAEWLSVLEKEIQLINEEGYKTIEL